MRTSVLQSSGTSYVIRAASLGNLRDTASSSVGLDPTLLAHGQSQVDPKSNVDPTNLVISGMRKWLTKSNKARMPNCRNWATPRGRRWTWASTASATGSLSTTTSTVTRTPSISPTSRPTGPTIRCDEGSGSPARGRAAALLRRPNGQTGCAGWVPALAATARPARSADCGRRTVVGQ